MAQIQINLLQSGIEQGNIGSSGNTSSTKHLRTTLYIPYIFNINNVVTISATSSNSAKTVECELIGYISDETTSRLFYKGFYAVPYEFDISSYSTVKFVRVLIRYSDSSVITPEEITSCTLSYNYMSIWTMDGEQAIPTQAMPIQQGRFIKPYPASLWRIDESNGGLPYNDLMLDILYVERKGGAFEDAASLASVHIPITVKTIGATAFKGTALQRVKIAADCTYDETSFPEGCVIERYTDDRYEQLRDGQGRAILDCDARRIYVRKVENTNG